jgi:iron only hydrogenase large subunit-like protein
MSFSSAIVLSDLNDFITPAQACIKPVESKKVAGAEANVHINNGEYYQVEKDGSQTKMEAASISLNDCLACSGCITSAESVLVQMQSHQEIYQILKSNAESLAVLLINARTACMIV